MRLTPEQLAAEIAFAREHEHDLSVRVDRRALLDLADRIEAALKLCDEADECGDSRCDIEELRAKLGPQS